MCGVTSPIVETVAPTEVFDLLADEYAREILALAKQEPMSAQELADACDVHHTTIYRRLERLEELGVIVGQGRIDPESGHHTTVYQTTLEEINVNLDRDHYHVTMRREADPADRMADMWRQIRGSDR